MFGSVVQLSETDLRLYYLVDGQSAGLANCVAVSDDGATWTKPSLGLIEWGARANRTSSKSNNSECCWQRLDAFPSALQASAPFVCSVSVLTAVASRSLLHKPDRGWLGLLGLGRAERRPERYRPGSSVCCEPTLIVYTFAFRSRPVTAL